MKELGGTWGRGGAREWSDVSERHRCPVCNGGSWCQVSRDADVVLCKRVAGDREKTNRNGAVYHVHHMNGAPRWQGHEAVHVAPRMERASVAVCDRAYRAVLEQLALDAGDRAALRARGLDDEAIGANGYRSLQIRERHRLALAVINAVGEHDAAGVPGIAWKEEGRRGWHVLAGAPGLVIPVRDLDGRVVALKVRRRDPCDGPRYLYVASAKHGGASANAALHVPVAARALRSTVPLLVLTEGELKADTSTALCGSPVVSIPGVGSWRMGVDLALAWGAERVAVALDMDRFTNRVVAEAAQSIVNELRRERVRVSLWQWDRRFKGLDDYLAARRRGEAQRAG